MMQILFTFFFVVVSLVLIGVILIQKGRGGGLTGAFGMGGGSDTLLGSIQNKEIVRWTAYLAAAFLIIAIARDVFPPQRLGVNVDEINAGAPMTATTKSEGSTSAPEGAPAPAAADGSQPASGGGGNAAQPEAPAGK
jgi:preprotein translocase subunit SecG